MAKHSSGFNHEIDPDEIFLDSRNSPDFDVQQMEGRLERPISITSLVFLGGFFLVVLIVFAGRASFLQIVRGDELRREGEANRLEGVPVFAERGVIYDRKGRELAWNEEGDNLEDFYLRAYRKAPGTGHVVGYVSHPRQDKRGLYWQKEVFGRDGTERFYDEDLNGVNGSKLIEVDAQGSTQSESLTTPPVSGENLSLTIDAELSEKLYGLMESLSTQVGFQGGAGVIMDIANGEIIVSTSFPEYRPEILSEGKDTTVISKYNKDSRKPFLNRVVSGLYTPGSIVKPYLAAAALEEGIIDPLKKILAPGFLAIPNPYFPGQETVFKDWKAHGLINMREAISQSSDVYFYELGGGYKDQEGLGIERIEEYARRFGVGEATGVDLPSEVSGIIPNPEWKKINFNGEAWLLGNTYHTSIGQYGFQVTPVQMVRAVASIANGGNLVSPHVRRDAEVSLPQPVEVRTEYLDIVKEGMRMGVAEGGTASGLNVGYVKVAGKTGTAELGVLKDRVNSWVTGFFPYENPRYAFAVVMERGPRGNTLGATYVMRGLLDWMSANAKEYFK